MNPDRTTLPRATKISDILTDLVARTLIRISLALPYSWRVPYMGWIMATVIGPLAGYTRRARTHIKYIMPEMRSSEVRRIANASLNNAGRTLIENYSTPDFLKRMKNAQITGPGLEALSAAAKSGRPVILVSGHFGNYEAVRAALSARGFSVGALYRPMSNPFFNDHYARTIEALGAPVFAKGVRGTIGFVRHLKAGGQMVLLMDQYEHGAPVLDFLGRPTPTSISAAELTLRHNALLVPFYGLRKSDGLNFECSLEAPIPHTDAITMTQKINKSLSERIQNDPGLWFWTARRWRGKA